MESGYFAGLILIAGQTYGLIVAPKATGETTGPWGERGTELSGADYLNDGLLNTQSMAAAGSEIATWAQCLEIGGHTDWYIPSRDETEIAYRNLKPTEHLNYCGYRDGENAFSVPMGGPYTKAMPATARGALFREGHSEAFEAEWYWSSTQCSAHDAFFQDFTDGTQGIDVKGSSYRVRAVRRFIRCAPC